MRSQSLARWPSHTLSSLFVEQLPGALLGLARRGNDVRGEQHGLGVQQRVGQRRAARVPGGVPPVPVVGACVYSGPTVS